MKHGGLLMAVGLVVAGCSGSSASEPEITAPPPTASPTSSATSDPPPTTEADASIPPTEPTATTSAPTATEPASDTTTSAEPPAEPPPLEALGPQLDSVPGVDTAGQIIELVEMVSLFVPSEPDPDDANVAVPLAEDIPIIEAYGRAMQALYGQVTQNPIPVEPTEATATTFLDGGAKYSENVFRPRNEAGQYLAFQGDGDVLRPVVLADPRSDDEAFIFDCAISGSNYVNADGTLVAGETPGIELAPLLVRLVRVDGTWIVDDIQDDERACR